MEEPPTIAVHNIPDAWGLYSPSPLNESVKIVGNIIELNNPTNNMAHIETNPFVSIDVANSVSAIVANKARTFAGATILVKYAPTKRPIIAPDQ